MLKTFSHVVAFGGGAFERYLGLDEFIRVVPHVGINAFIRRGKDTRTLFP